MKKLLLVLILFFPGTVIVLMAMGKCENHFDQLPVYGEMPTYTFTGLDGDTINNESQTGKITLFTTLQTSCPKECAIDLFKFNLQVFQDFRKNQHILKDVQIVSIVTDKEGNPVDSIQELTYILDEMVNKYDPNIWKLVVGDPKQVYDIEHNGHNIYEVDIDSTFAGKYYLGTMLLVDKQNQLRLIGRGHQEGYIRDFKQHISLLNQEYHDLAKKEKEEQSDEK